VAQRVSREWRGEPAGDLRSVARHIRPALRGRRRFRLRHLLTVVRAGLRCASFDGALVRAPTRANRPLWHIARRG
jgi:hypothetical protein